MRKLQGIFFFTMDLVIQKNFESYGPDIFAIFHISSVLINSNFPVQILQLKILFEKENSNSYSQKSIQQNYLRNLRALFPNVIIFQEEIKVGNDTISCCNWRNSKSFFFFFSSFSRTFFQKVLLLPPFKTWKLLPRIENV